MTARAATPPRHATPAAPARPARATPGSHARLPHHPGGRHAGVKGACGVAARALRAPVTPGAARAIRQRSRPWDQTGTLPHLSTSSAKLSDKRINQAQEQQKLDGPLHMRSPCVGSPEGRALIRACSSGWFFFATAPSRSSGSRSAVKWLVSLFPSPTSR